MTQDPQQLAAVVAKEQMNWPSLAITAAIKEQWSNPGTPVYYVLDHEGVIRHTWVGDPGGEAIDAAVAALLLRVPGTQGSATSAPAKLPK